MMRYYIVFVSVFILFLGACTNTTAGEADQHDITLAHNHATDHPVHASLEKFKGEVETNSDGDMQVTIYANEQLGSEREVIELTQTGAVDATKVNAAALESFRPEYLIFNLPYLFETDEEFKAKMNDPEVADVFMRLPKTSGSSV